MAEIDSKTYQQKFDDLKIHIPLLENFIKKSTSVAGNPDRLEKYVKLVEVLKNKTKKLVLDLIKFDNSNT